MQAHYFTISFQLASDNSRLKLVYEKYLSIPTNTLFKDFRGILLETCDEEKVAFIHEDNDPLYLKSLLHQKKCRILQTPKPIYKIISGMTTTLATPLTAVFKHV